MTTLKRYLAAIILFGLAAILALAGLLSVTKWKPAQVVEATGTTGAPFLTTRPGLFGLYGEGDSVNLTATAADPDQPIWIVLGSQSDASGWLRGHEYEEIYGLTDLDTLKMEEHGEPAPEPEPAPQSGEEPQSGQAQSGEIEENPMASDMWVLEKNASGSLQMNISGDQMNLVLIATTNGEDPAPSITLQWDTPANNYASIFLFSFAALFFLFGVFVWFILWRTQRKRNAIRKRMQQRLQADTTETSVIPVVAPDEAEVDLEDEEVTVEEITPDVELEEDPADPDETPVETEVETEVLEDEVWAPEVVAESEEETVERSGASEEEAPEADVPEEEAGESAEVSTESAEAFLDKTQQLTSDSGMINLAALRGGAKFPTRRALREAQASGVETFIIDGEEFPTTRETPQVSKVDEESLRETSNLLGQRSSRSERWSSAFGGEESHEGEPEAEKDNADE